MTVKHIANESQVRFSLYDADHDERLQETELIGSAVLDINQISAGQPVKLELHKGTGTVTGCYLLVNPSMLQRAETLAAAEAAESVSSEVKRSDGKYTVKLSAQGL